MNRQTTATLPTTTTYDDCLIATCLKKLFTKRERDIVAPDYKIATTVAEIKKDLELVNKENIFELSYAYLAAMEAAITGADFRYVVFYEKKQPVLFVYFQLYTLTSRNFNLEKDKGFVKGIFRFFLDLTKISVVISGNALRSETSGFCYDKSILSNDAAAEIMVSLAEKIADADCANALILKDIPGSTNFNKWITKLGYHKPIPDNVMEMTVKPAWESITDYVNDLSRKYKTRAKKVLAAAENITIKPLSENDIIQNNFEINRLFKNVAENQSFILTMPGELHFSGLKNVFKDGFEVYGFFVDEQLVGFYSAFISEDSYELYYAGLDYSYNNQYQLYFNILFSGLERAIHLGKSKLMLGRTSFDAKASLGAKALEMDYFIKTANIPTIVFKWFANYFSSMEDGKWKLRNPLKPDAEQSVKI